MSTKLQKRRSRGCFDALQNSAGARACFDDSTDDSKSKNTRQPHDSLQNSGGARGCFEDSIGTKSKELTRRPHDSLQNSAGARACFNDSIDRKKKTSHQPHDALQNSADTRATFDDISNFRQYARNGEQLSNSKDLHSGGLSLRGASLKYEPPVSFCVIWIFLR